MRQPVRMPDAGTAVERRLQAWSPVVGRPPGFEDADVSYTVTDTVIGRMLLARTDRGALVASRFVASVADEDAVLDRLSRVVSPRVLRLPARLEEACRQLDDVVTGRRRDVDVDVDLALASPFQRSVLEALRREVPYGARSTYGALAAAIGRPTAVRAVGAALGANPVCVVVPCHRVVGANGELTGYAGGVAAKRYLLDLEDAPASSGGSGR